MEKKPYLAKGYNKGLNKINTKDEWNEVAEELNSIGPPFRTGEGWLKVWGDFKFKLKKKLSHNKAESHATGGGAFKQFALSPVEEAAVSLLQLRSIVQHKEPFGLKRARSSSPKQVLSADEVFDIVIEETVQTSTPAKKCKKNISGTTGDLSLIEEPCSFSKTFPNAYSDENVDPNNSKKVRKNRECEKLKLLEKQVEYQKEISSELKKSLTEIEKYTRRIYKIKEEKLKLFKEELKRKEEHRKELLKIRAAELEIKKKKLEIDLL